MTVILDTAPCPHCPRTEPGGNFTRPTPFLLRAVSVDLDDTLYPQAVWLDGAWRAVADAAAVRYGLSRHRMYEALVQAAGPGSDRGGIIDRALARVGSKADPGPLVAVFRSYRTGQLAPYRGVVAALRWVRRVGVRIAVVTDGHPPQQRDKLAALGLDALADAVVVSDELGGRRFRKPAPEPFLEAARRLGVRPGEMAHVGDRPDKDVAGAHASGLLGAARVRTGEYAELPCGVPELGCYPDAASALIHLVSAASDPRSAP
ncbi:HAD family hydrolase [Streptomyces sp. IBSNAI002]|uniref:HAD family hydrolase n=1 Tax=Streptomyces sp. IBSNAI002 TaxID=3457500 RepID=UPI003FD196D2